MQLEFRPLVTWPRALTNGRKRAPFKSSWDSTLRLLEHELRMLGADSVIIQLAVRQSSDIRLGGQLRPGASLHHPGVVVSFESKHGPQSFPCDTYGEFRDNVRAVALALEALRAVDRYGVTATGEQYRGFTALPPPKPPMTREEAERVLSSFSGVTPSARLPLGELYREAVKAVHPDRGGKRQDFDQVQQAKEVLGL
jgi:hypothetical protein